MRLERTWIFSLVLSTGLFALQGHLFAQTVVLGDTMVNACAGQFTDSGGFGASYAAGENTVMTLCPDGTDTHLQLSFSRYELTPGDRLCLYDGPDTTATLITCLEGGQSGTPVTIQATAANPSGCLTIHFESSGAAAGWEANLDCIGRCQTIIAQLDSIFPSAFNGDPSFSALCPGDQLQVYGGAAFPQNNLFYPQSEASAGFRWDFGDGFSALGPTVVHTYQKPGAYQLQLTVEDQTGCESVNFLSRTILVSAPPAYQASGLLPDTLCSGDTLELRANINSFYPSAQISAIPQTFGFELGRSQIDGIPLPDGDGRTYQTQITFRDFRPGQELTNPEELDSICINIEHSWMRDLEIRVICPNGQSSILHQHPGERGKQVFLGEPIDNDDADLQIGRGTDYCWSNNADNDNWINYANANLPDTLPSGQYRPFESLDQLLGCPLNGVWTLEVQDLWQGDNGFVFYWNIHFSDALFPDQPLFTPFIEGSNWSTSATTITQSPLQLLAISETAGDDLFRFSTTDDLGCTFDSSFNLPVRPFTHPLCGTLGCLPETDPLPPDTTVCQGDSLLLVVQTDTLPGDTSLVFETNPEYELGASNHPHDIPYAAALPLSNLALDTLSDPIAQIQSVCLNLSTDWDEDIRLFLQSPDGKILELSTDNGGSGDNYQNTCFSPTAVTAITAAAPPFTGNFQPEGDWNDLRGSPVNGDWVLLVSDGSGLDILGTLHNWSISFLLSNQISYRWSSNLGLSCTDCDSTLVQTDSSGWVQLEIRDAFDCSYIDSMQVNVLDSLPAPEINCGLSGPGRLTFNWTQEQDSLLYRLNVIINGRDSLLPQLQAENFYTVTGLQAGDTVGLEVRVIPTRPGFPCAIGTGFGECIYEPCFINAELSLVENVSCAGAEDGRANITVTDGQGPYRFYFNGALSPDSSGRYDNLPPGLFFVIAEDANFCRDTVLVNIGEPDTLRTNLSLEKDITCNGDQNGVLFATPSGGNGNYLYDWGDPIFQNQSRLEELPAGTYLLTVTDSRNCTAMDSIELTDPPLLSLNLNTEDIQCAGEDNGAISAEVAGGQLPYQYEWSTDDTFPNLFNLSAGEYCLSLTDARGCLRTACTIINEPALLQIDSFLSQDVSCNGGSNGQAVVFASGGTGNYQYSWNDSLGQIGQMAGQLPAGPVVVTVQDANACLASASVIIAEPEPLAANAVAQDASCLGNADGQLLAFPEGGTPDYQLSWSNGQEGNVASGLAAGDYGLTITDANDCRLIRSLSVSEPEAQLFLEVEQSLRGCFGEQGNAARVNAQGGSGAPFIYNWSDGQSTPTAIDLDSLVYSVSVTDADGCTESISIKLQDLPDMDPNMIINTPSCFGFTNGAIGINLIEGRPQADLNFYRFEWNTGARSPIINNLVGDSTYSVTITDPQGCIATESRFVKEPQLITFEVAAQDVSCFGLSDGSLRVQNIQADSRNFTYQWDAAAGSATTAAVENLPAGKYQVTVTDESNCFNVGLGVVEQPNDLQLQFEVNTIECFGDPSGVANVLPSGGVPDYSYLWSTGAQTRSISGLTAGNYQVTVTDGRGCSKTGNININQPDPFDVMIETQDVSCFGDRDGTISIRVNGGQAPYRYSLNNEVFTGSPVRIGLTAGNYNVYIRDNNDCLLASSVIIEEPLPFTVDAGDPNYTLPLGDSILLRASATHAQGMVDFVWEPPFSDWLSCLNCPETLVRPLDQISIRLRGIDSIGCEATDIVTLFVSKSRIVLVPTGFSPNGDGENDLLLVHGQPNVRINTFRVFDRWGELVFEKEDFDINDPSTGWDGTHNGQPAPLGVYLWFLEAEFPDGQTAIYRGQTTLIQANQ